MTVSGTLGAYFFKRTSGKQEKLLLLEILKMPSLYMGGAFYVAGAVINIILLKYMDYSVLYPMTSLTYIWTTILAWVALHEKINYNKLIAIILIIMGVFVLNI